MQKLELLAPAGSFSAVKAVVHAGADAVYFGGGLFSARAYADNLSKEEILEAIDFGHIHGRKMMLAVNTLLKEKELEEQLYDYLLPYYERGLDAVIVQDFGVMQFVREQFKGLPIHTSTQMTVTGEKGAKFLEKAGASRIVLARELSLAEIGEIRRAVSVELESFVHGALCYCYSGQCLFSSILGGRSGNRGRCAQPCRLPYEAGGQMRYPLSPKDLCALALLPKLIKSGVTSFKIEGRMKQVEYAAGVVSIYRAYLDQYKESGEANYFVKKEDRQKLFDLGNRNGFTEGYYERKNGSDMITFSKSSHENHAAHTEFCKAEVKAKARGKFTAKKGVPIEFRVAYGDTEVFVIGDIPSIAQKQPLTEETLRAKLTKTGNTPFALEELVIDLEENLFLSMASVNELRRKAFAALEEAYLRPYKRTVEKKSGIKQEKENFFSEKKPFFLSAFVETKEQIPPLFEHPSIRVIYVDSAVFSRDETIEGLSKLYENAKKAGKLLYYVLPAIFRRSTLEFYQAIFAKLKADGFLAKSYDALSFLLAQQIDPGRIRIDYSLYTWSNRSKAAFFALGIGGDTVPLELNRAEIRHRNNADSEMLLYGHLPLMTSAQCIQKNLFGCKKSPRVHFLKDRYGISFPVKNHCNECYNCIYNSRPLVLFSAAEELKSFGIGSFRFSFTIESGAQAAHILEIYEKSLSFGAEYTYGHYKRGVE